mgnify:CR=1 FL=1
MGILFDCGLICSLVGVGVSVVALILALGVAAAMEWLHNKSQPSLRREMLVLSFGILELFLLLFAGGATLFVATSNLPQELFSLSYPRSPLGSADRREQQSPPLVFLQ